MFQFVHICIYQFAFTRPLWSIVSCILYYFDMYHKGEMNPVTMAVTALLYICLGIAMWALLQVYRVFRVVLAPYNTGSKFLAIKVYIFLHALQGFVFAQIESRSDGSSAIDLTQFQFMLMTIEMMIGALLNMFVFFSVKEYVSMDDAHNMAFAETVSLRSKTGYTRVEEDNGDSKLDLES